MLETYGSGRFCGAACARSFSTKNKRVEINKSISKSLKGRNLSENHRLNLKDSWSKREHPTVYNKLELDIILVENSKYSTQTVKRRILQENVLEYCCAKCPNKGEHNNKPLTLQLHHINGKNKDHRLSNLEFLCPNCHSQTENYAGKIRPMSKLINTSH